MLWYPATQTKAVVVDSEPLINFHVLLAQDLADTDYFAMISNLCRVRSQLFDYTNGAAMDRFSFIIY